MAQPVWLKKYLRIKPEVNKIFDDLAAYKEFCVRKGFVFDEAHLYNERTPYGDFVRSQRGKDIRNNWTTVIIESRRG